MVIPFQEGDHLVSIDYSNIEYRLLAHFCKDAALLKIFEDGEDFHGSVAKRLKIKRDVAKTFNFAQLYGSGVKHLADKTGVSEDRCRSIIATYNRMYPGVSSFKKSVSKYAEAHGGIRNPFGRWRVIPIEMSYIAVNTLIQGTAADILKIALTRVDDFLSDKLSKLLFPVHDEIVINWKKADGDIITPIVGLMETFEGRDKPFFGVPISADVSISELDWGTKKELGFRDYLEVIFSADTEESAIIHRFKTEKHKREWWDWFGKTFTDVPKDQGLMRETMMFLTKVEGLIDGGISEKEFSEFIKTFCKERNVFEDELEEMPKVQKYGAYKNKREVERVQLPEEQKVSPVYEDSGDNKNIVSGCKVTKKHRKKSKRNKVARDRGGDRGNEREVEGSSSTDGIRGKERKVSTISSDKRSGRCKVRKGKRPSWAGKKG
jgi:hypothetical protein